MNLLRDNAPELSEESINAALRRADASPAQYGAGNEHDGQLDCELDSGLADLHAPRRASFAVPHHDPLQGSAENGSDEATSTIATSGIVISEQVRALIEPLQQQQGLSSAASQEELGAETPLPDTPTYADEASFYPEDDVDPEVGVAV